MLALLLVAGTVQAQTVNPANFNVDIRAVASGLSVKILNATPCGMSYTSFTVQIQQYFGKVDHLWVDGVGWEGQETIGTILMAHPTWNFYGVSANGTCQNFYSSGTGYEVDGSGNPVYVNGYVKRYRVFTGGIMVIYNAQVGVEYFIPYNDYSFNYIDANNLAYPSDYGFGAGIMTTGETKEISAIFSNCWDASGKPIVVKKTVTVPSSAWSRYNCTTEAPPPPPVVPIAPTDSQKGQGKPPKK